MKPRTKAREVALQYLYKVDQTSDNTGSALDDFMRHFVDDEELIPYAREIIAGVYDNIKEIDALIDGAAQNWTVERMSSTDRNILRIAVLELKFKDDIPYQVAINEAVEMAKRFGSPKFPAFANGVLDKVRTEVV